MTTRRRLLAISCALGMAVTLMAQSASAATILVFGQSGGANLFTGDENMGVTTLNAPSIPIAITTLNEAPSLIPAVFSLNAVSAAPAVQSMQVPGAWTQLYNGTFQITSVGPAPINFLSGVFTGITLGLVGGNQLVLGAGTTPPLALTFTSDVMGMPLGVPRAMALSLTNLTPSFSISNNSFGDFSANVAGDFSAQQLQQPIPEPAVMFMLASGLVGLAAAARRRQKNARQREA